MAADAPKNSPPSPSSSSPPNSSSNNSTSPPSPSPPNWSSPPPESPPSTPEKSPPPPKEEPSPPPPSPSPPPPPPTPSPPPPSPPPPLSSPPPPSSSPPPPPSPPPPSPSKGSNQTHVHATHHTPPPPKLTRQIASPPTVPPPPKHSPPPPKSHSSDSNSNTDDGSNSNNISSQLPLILGLTAGVVLLLVIVISLVIVVCCKKKKKETMHHNNHMQYYSNYTPPQGDGGYGNAAGLDPAGHMNNGLEANNVPPYGGAAGPGGWQQPPSPQGQTPSTQGHMSYSSEMSSNVAGQPIPPPAHALPSSPLGLNQSSFSYEELSMATFGFSQGQMLGQGGFGYVHKGVLAGGKEVAVKSLKSGSGQGEREFQAEVETISRVHHRHLVSLVGYCVSGERRMLVYEFLPNKTLEYHLHEQGPMDWPTRLKIALGAAKGLAYLHEDCHPRIIHRDIKSANILLDYTFEAKVADFGLAKLTQDNNTHVSTRVMGTFGYLAPEYASSGKLTEKSDVFSFGVVLLELITGRRPLDLNSNMDESLVDWARPLCETAMETGNFRELVDPRLENNFVHLEMARMVACAGASIRHSARRRPKMRQIVRALEDDVPLDEVKGVVAATQSSRFSTTNDTAGAEYDSSSYSADMKKFRKMVMDSQDYSSSDFGNTGEYGHNPSSSSSSGSSGPIAPTQS